MKRTQSQVQQGIGEPEDAAQWEHGHHPKQRFECLKCEPPHITTVFGFGDDMVWPRSPDFDA